MPIRAFGNVHEKWSRVGFENVVHFVVTNDDCSGPDLWRTVTLGQQKNSCPSVYNSLPILGYSLQPFIPCDNYPVICSAKPDPLGIGNSLVACARVDLIDWMNLESRTTQNRTHSLSMGAIQKDLVPKFMPLFA